LVGGQYRIGNDDDTTWRPLPIPEEWVRDNGNTPFTGYLKVYPFNGTDDENNGKSVEIKFTPTDSGAIVMIEAEVRV
jgi:hypothetical protein